MRVVEGDGHRRMHAVLLVAALLLTGWLAWFFFARVNRYEVSESARIEVAQASHHVEAPIAGKVARVPVALGVEVAAGDVLLEIDAEHLRLEMEEKSARLATVVKQIDPLSLEIDEQENAIRDAANASRAAIAEAMVRTREADEAARFQEGEAARASRLREHALISEADAARFDADAKSKRTVVEVSTLSAARIAAEGRTKSSEKRVELARLKRELTALKGEQRALDAALVMLADKIERHKIRAPVAGRIGEMADLRVGAFVQEGDRIATVVPPGELAVVAEFPASAMGRLSLGQHARLRLDAFPWTEYGTVPAVVERIATEAPQGRFRVELGVLPEPTSTIPIAHGLSGSVVIDVERTSPAELVLRAAGKITRTGRSGGP